MGQNSKVLCSSHQNSWAWIYGCSSPNWLVVSTPLKHMIVSWDSYCQYTEKQNSYSKHVQTTNRPTNRIEYRYWSTVTPRKCPSDPRVGLLRAPYQMALQQDITARTWYDVPIEIAILGYVVASVWTYPHGFESMVDHHLIFFEGHGHGWTWMDMDGDGWTWTDIDSWNGELCEHLPLVKIRGVLNQTFVSAAHIMFLSLFPLKRTAELDPAPRQEGLLPISG